ncbi:MAG: mevalonate kinase, partial [Thermoanaerobaculaceae bacterium]
PFVRELRVPRPIPIVVGMTGVESLTARMVANVRAAWEHNPALYERIFREIDVLALEGVKAVEAYDLEALGELMNVCQGLLNALGVSTWELEELVQVARRHGAAGAKLTGGGGGGSMIALCPEGAEKVVQAMERAGYRAFATEVG